MPGFSPRNTTRASTALPAGAVPAARPRAMFSNPREASAEELNESTVSSPLIALT